MKKLQLACITCLLPLALSAAQPSSNITLLPQVIVQATKLPTALPTLGNSAKTLEKSQLQHYFNLSEAINTLPEVVGITNGTQTLFVRGLPSNYTAIVMDNFSLQDPSTPQGTPYLDALLLPLGRLELLETSQGSLYGSNAIAGVLQLEPDLWTNSYSIQAASQFSSARLQLSQKCRGTKVYVGFAHQNDSRLSDLRNTQETDTKTRLLSQTGIEQDLWFNLKAQWHFFEQKAWLNRDDFYSQSDDPNAIHESRRTGNKAQLSWEPNSSWKTLLRFTQNNLLRSDRNPTDNVNPSAYGSNNSYSSKLETWTAESYWTPSTEFSALAGFETVLESAAFSNTPYQQRKYSVYTLEKWGESTQFTAGARLHNDDFNQVGIYSLGLYHPLNAQIAFTSHLNTGYRSPSLYELHGEPPDTQSNLTLKPEYSKGYDIGFKLSLSEDIQITTSYFENEVNNPISYALFDFVNYYGKYSNGSSHRVSKGSQWQLETALGDGQLSAGWTFIESKDGSTNTVRVPDNKGTLTLNYPLHPFSTHTQLLYIGKRFDKDNNDSTVTLPSYTLLNERIDLELSKNTTISLGIENMFNIQYEALWGYQTLSRNFTLSLNGTF